MINETNQLSEREREILQLVATGLSNQQIANELGISVNTVKVHLRNVFGKTGVASRAEAAMYAVRNGIVAIERAEPTITQPPVPHDSTAVPLAPEPSAEPATSLVQPDLIDRSDPTLPADQIEPVRAAPVEEARSLEAVPDRAPAVVPPATVVDQPRSTGRRRWMILAAGLALVVVAALAIQQRGWLNGTNAVGTPNSPPIVEDAQRWQELPALPAGRAALAIAVANDLVYVIGGEQADGITASVDRYNAQSGTWTALSDKPTAVADVRVAVLGGRIYVPGGRRSTDPADVSAVFERYDPTTEEWEPLPPLPAPRSAYALAAVEGTLYLFGGWDGSSYRDEVFAYDPDQEKWRTLTSLPTARAYMDAGVVDGSVYVIGGQNERGALTSNEIYRPAQEGAQPWSRGAPLPAARSHFSLTAASTLLHLVGGEGDDLQPLKYDTRADNWQRFSAAPQPIGSQPGSVPLDEMILILGGRDAQGGYADTLQSYQALFTVFGPVER